MSALFSAAGLAVRELQRTEIPALQAFFDANPGYSLLVNGVPPPADAAAVDFDERPPPHLGYTRHFTLGAFDGAGALQAAIFMDSDLGTAGCWHIGLFFVAERLHGQGAAAALYGALEAWVRAQGALWLRLGVVAANRRAHRFWQRCGFAELRVREGVDTGGRINTIHVMLKPLAGRGLADYLQQVPRDRPGSTLA